ncbi:hypothetical protein ERICV_02890 [Paenibacillus larvae subsp. larvae]|uniref:Uncharacterized protein n=1 Tax=Paenibacillus larvae subsp. larvae TaxID=147375 RepID=A0A6C0QTD9_9BACL|nr:hypothetical protein ERICV_02890 [Paenibacillus larvae subsp. larvae]
MLHKHKKRREIHRKRESLEMKLNYYYMTICYRTVNSLCRRSEPIEKMNMIPSELLRSNHKLSKYQPCSN